MIRVEWDDKKAEANYRKHGIHFEEVKVALFDPYCIDERDCYKFEDPWRTIGLSKNNLLFVVHTARENGIEVIIPVPIANATNGRANAPVCGMLRYRFCTTAM
jgi:uncharacterized DUF497 family protein